MNSENCTNQTTATATSEVIEQAVQEIEEIAKSCHQLLDNPPDENYKTTDILLVRHGFSEYNYSIDSFKEKTNKSIHSEDAKSIRLNIGDIDTPLHTVGKIQAENTAKHLLDLDIDTVFVSPLLRTLQTADLLFANHPNKEKIKFIVLPEISEGLCFSCSFAPLAFSKIRQSQFPNFDFSRGTQFESPAVWQMEQIQCPITMKEALEKFKGSNDEAELSKIFLNELDRLFPSYIETHKHLWDRSQKGKEIILNYQKSLQPGKKIVIVSHYIFTLFMTSSAFISDFNQMDGIKCKNAKLICW